MAITKSAKKAHRQSLKRKVRNIKKRNATKDILKEILSLVAQKKIKEAEKLLPQVYKILDKVAKSGLIKKNTVSRKKSRIARLINKASKAQ